MFPAVLIQIIVVLALAGLALWAISQFPLDATIAKLIRVIIVVAVAIWAIYLLAGLFGGGVAPLGVYRR